MISDITTPSKGRYGICPCVKGYNRTAAQPNRQPVVPGELRGKDGFMTSETLQFKASGQSKGEPTPDEKLEQLERILHSGVFHGAGSLATLLEYLVRQSIDNASSQVKEYTIALEVFGRGSEFDPRTNSVVRVQAKNLRAKLQEYYETEGKSDRVLIDLPKGHYRVVFSYVEPEPESASGQASQTEAGLQTAPARPETVAQPGTRKSDLTSGLLISAVAILSVVVVLLAVSNINLRSRSQLKAPPTLEIDPQGVWAPFLKAENSTLLVLSNPPVFRFLNNSDSKVASKEAMQIGLEQAQMLARVLGNNLVMKQGGAPRLVLSTSSYTGMGEAIGMYYLTDMFRSAGLDLTLKQSRTVSAEDLKSQNIVALGSVWVNNWSSKLPFKQDFIYTDQVTVKNLNPLSGEQPEYRPIFDDQTGQLAEEYALITVGPNISGRSGQDLVMVLAGLHSEGTAAAAEYITSKQSLTEFNQRLTQAGGGKPPQYYQALLKVGVDNGIPTTITLAAIHELRNFSQ